MPVRSYVLKWWSRGTSHLTNFMIKVMITRVIFMENFRGINYCSYHAWRSMKETAPSKDPSCMNIFFDVKNTTKGDPRLFPFCVCETKMGRVFGQAMIFVLGSISPSNLSEASQKRPFRPSHSGKDDGHFGCPKKYPTLPNIDTILSSMEMDQHREIYKK